MESTSINKEAPKKMRGFGCAKKAEIESILETGKAVIRRNLKTNHKMAVGDNLWWAESLKMKRSQARIHSVIDKIETEQNGDRTATILYVTRID